MTIRIINRRKKYRKNQQLTEKEQQIMEQSQQLVEKEQQITEQSQQLAETSQPSPETSLKLSNLYQQATAIMNQFQELEKASNNLQKRWKEVFRQE